MRITPQHRVFMFQSLLPHDPDDILMPNCLNWHLEPGTYLPGQKPTYRYLCYEGMYACGDEHRCRTPEFSGLDIPEEIEDYVRKFTETFAIGVAWANTQGNRK